MQVSAGGRGWGGARRVGGVCVLYKPAQVFKNFLVRVCFLSFIQKSSPWGFGVTGCPGGFRWGIFLKILKIPLDDLPSMFILHGK